MKNSDRITVIIVTYNSRSTIKNCLDSLLRFSPGSEIIVVDNCSDDKTGEVVKSYGQRVRLFESPENVGFAKGNNLAFNNINTEYIVFINPDTQLVEADSLEKLQEVLRKNPQFGLIGPMLLYPDGKVRKTVRKLPTISGAFWEYILGKKGAYDFYQPETRGLTEVESIVGACMMTKKETFKKAGKFDEKYFLYFEDLELCKKVRQMGLKIGYLPEVVVEHIEGVSGRSNTRTGELLYQSAKKYHGWLEFYLIQLIIRVGQFRQKLGN